MNFDLLILQVGLTCTGLLIACKRAFAASWISSLFEFANRTPPIGLTDRRSQRGGTIPQLNITAECIKHL